MAASKKNLVIWDDEEFESRFPDYKWTVSSLRDAKIRHYRVRVGGEEFEVD